MARANGLLQMVKELRTLLESHSPLILVKSAHSVCLHEKVDMPPLIDLVLFQRIGRLHSSNPFKGGLSYQIRTILRK